MRILPTGNLLFSGKQRISLSTNFPMHVNQETKETFPSCMSNEGNTGEVYIPSENKRIRDDHGIIKRAL